MLRSLILSAAFLLPAAVMAQASPQTSGTEVVVPGMGEVTNVNDEVRLIFTADEQDKDRATAVANASRKMKEGMEALRAIDKTAILRTRDYRSYPVYENQTAGSTPRITGWRATQTLEVTTNSLDILPKTVAAAQKAINLNGMQYGLSRALTKKLDQQRIDAAYRDLTERLGFIAKAMGRSPADAVIGLVDYEASGAYAQSAGVPVGAMARMSNSITAYGNAVGQERIEPVFEPGETTLSMRVVAKVRFK